MKIGIFTEIYKPVLNGVVVSIESFREQMERSGHEVYIFTPAYMAYPDDHILPFHSLPLPTRTPYRLTLPLRVNRRVALPHLDVVHAQSPFATGLLAWRQARREGIPLLFTYHTRLVDYSHYVPAPAALTRSFLVWLSRSYANLADRVVVPSNPIKALLESYGVRRPIDVVPTPVRLPLPGASAGADLRAQYGVPLSARLLLNVGRLAHEKNVPLLLEAFALVATGRDVYLLLVGDGPLRSELESRARELGVGDRVRFAGFVGRDAIAACYAAADLFVFTSVTETQGLVVDEALQGGLPVLAVAAGGVMDVLARCQAGRMVTNREDRGHLRDDYAAALAEVLDAPDTLAAWRDRARTWAQVLCTEDGASRLLAVYHQAVAQAGTMARPVSSASEVTGPVGRGL